ncbi:TAXI family TRAP transporter solute-binding subunit [Planctomycetota bacterium]
MRAVPLAVCLTFLCPLAQAYDLTFATGPKGGAYDRLGSACAKVVTDEAAVFSVTFQLSPGSVWNIRALQAGDVQLAFAQSDILSAATRGEEGFASPASEVRALAVVYEETLHLLARRDSGVTSYEDLRGKRVSLGSEGSGTHWSAQTVLAAHGIEPSDMLVRQESLEDTLKAFEMGELDAMFLVSTVPSIHAQRLLSGGQATVVPVDTDKVEDLDARGAFRLTSVFAEDYAGLSEDADTLAVDAVLCGRSDLTRDAVYEILTICFKQREELETTAGVDLDEFTPDELPDIPFAFHPGAVTFYYEQAAVDLPVQVHTGFYVEDIFNFDIRTQTYDVLGGVWFKWRGQLKGGDEEFPFKLLSGQLTSNVLKKTERFGGWTYLYYEFTATMHGHFELSRYPFDRQYMELSITHQAEAVEDLVFVADQTFDGTEGDLEKSVGTRQVADWMISDVGQSVSAVSYGTDFGSPLKLKTEQTRWSRYTLKFEIERILFPYLIKFMGPLLIIVLMSFVVFFINAKEFEVQASIVITALLSCVAFHITQADNLPDVGYLVTADKFFIVSYTVIFFSLLEVVLENHYHHSEQHNRAALVDKISRILFPLMFAGPITYLILSSL